ncbi:MAG: c-type cytochrome [Mizugakiibacter sp.]|uniref:c-type cytochrome n=1 Tax=Mizugakiibacter sp. TaxID=1972610 RepID=UPI0031C06B64|nr:c-type cytochrome [Xanthomonadaceae bacterium]
MSRYDRFAGAAAALALIGIALAAHARDYGLGHPASAQQIAGWDIDVRPDGTGLPDGQGSVADGEQVYEANCAACHGTFGDSNEYIALAGGVGSLASGAPVRTVGSKLNYATTLFDYINRAMPFPHSKSLSADEVYAVAAYVLNLNDIVPADFVANRQTLPAVKMPNRDGFKPFPGMMSVRGKPDVRNTACMKDCEKAVAITGQLPAGFVEGMYGDIRDNFRGLATMNEAPPPAGAAPAGAPSGHALTQQYGCVACHGTDKAIVGPAFRDVARKYQGDATATAHLTRKIREGGSGVWGSVPMPPQTGPSDVELTAIIQWVLAGAKTP